LVGTFETKEPERFSVFTEDYKIITKKKLPKGTDHKAWGIVGFDGECAQMHFRDHFYNHYDDAFNHVLSHLPREQVGTFPIREYYDLGNYDSYNTFMGRKSK
jgi:hypothetical protein